jgi:hypothetical protein
MQSLPWFKTHMEVDMLQLTRLLPLFSVRTEVRRPSSGNWRPGQLAITLWRSACRHAERPDRVVPYY